MYTNIQTGPALHHISQLILREENKSFHHYNSNALISALQIVFNNNILQFGDTYWRQISGTGMGIAPAPPWATIYYAIHENSFLPSWKTNLLFYRRFIDDVFGIWLCDPHPDKNTTLWASFQNTMQGWYGLEWEFSNLTNTCNFMDLSLSIVNQKIHSTLYEKKQNLYLYIPPNSSHPTGMLSGLIHGNVTRIHRLCSSTKDIRIKTLAFYDRLTQRGYNKATLDPLFKRAITNAQKNANNTYTDHTHQTQQNAVSKQNVFLHLQYHPQDPRAKEIQHVWERTITRPPGQPHISNMTNYEGARVPIDTLTIAYSRPPNLRNQLSIRTLRCRGQEVSTFLI
ncbi:hypothetical protein ACHAW6_011260 [Cyclotella cf. meneghiniana]